MRASIVRPSEPDDASPNEPVHQLSEAHRRLLEALETSRRAGEDWLAAPLSRSLEARDRYQDSLLAQRAAEDAFYAAKGAVAEALAEREDLKRS